MLKIIFVDRTFGYIYLSYETKTKYFREEQLEVLDQCPNVIQQINLQR